MTSRIRRRQGESRNGGEWFGFSFFVLACALALAACSAAADQPALLEVSLDEPFTLRVGQQAIVRPQALRLRFEDVLEDSRCPQQVECFWTGQARLAVVVQRGNSEPETVEFNTNPAPDVNRQQLKYEGVTIQLEALDPYPQHPDNPIPMEDYQATFVVTIP